MATGETGFDDVTFDLISVQYHSLKAGHDYGQYVRDARNAGKEEIAAFFEKVMAEDSAGAQQCDRVLAHLTQDGSTSPSPLGTLQGGCTVGRPLGSRFGSRAGRSVGSMAVASSRGAVRASVRNP